VGAAALPLKKQPIRLRENTQKDSRKQYRRRGGSSTLGDEDEVNSQTNQQGQVGQLKHNRDWWALQNIGEVSNSVASRRALTASMTKIIVQYGISGPGTFASSDLSIRRISTKFRFAPSTV